MFFRSISKLSSLCVDSSDQREPAAGRGIGPRQREAGGDAATAGGLCRGVLRRGVFVEHRAAADVRGAAAAPPRRRRWVPAAADAAEPAGPPPWPPRPAAVVSPASHAHYC
jgi:hypothetical protein